MTLSKGQSLALSLSAIGLYWLYQIAWKDPRAPLPTRFSDFALLVVTKKLVMFAAILLLLRLGGSRLRDVGVSRDAWPRHAGIGLLIGLAMFVALNVGLSSMLSAVLPALPGSGPGVMSFFVDPANLIVWIPIGIFGGGVVEELERIFVITRMELWLGRRGLVLGVVLSSIMFGWGHLYQGYGAALTSAVSGLVFSAVYLRRRSALEPMTAHAFSDILAMTVAMLIAK